MGTGDDVQSVWVSFDVWSEQKATYSLQKQRLKRAGIRVPLQERVEEIADRVLLPASIATHDWSGGGEITLKREGGRMTLLVNDESIRDFAITWLPFNQIGVGAAFPRPSKLRLSRRRESTEPTTLRLSQPQRQEQAHAPVRSEAARPHEHSSGSDQQLDDVEGPMGARANACNRPSGLRAPTWSPPR